MKTTIIAVASALLLAVAVTELSQRIWPDSRLALYALTFIALLVSGVFNARQAIAGAAVGAAAPAGERGQRRRRERNRSGRDGKRNDQGDRQNRKGEPRRSEDRDGKSSRSGGKGDGGARPERQKTSAPAAPADGPREEGTVKWFNRSKGFGFVVRPNGEEIFVHQRSIRSEQGKGRPVLKDGEAVSFVVTERERGIQAEDVVPVGAG